MVSEGDPVKWSRFSLSYFTGRVNGENGNMQVVKVLNIAGENKLRMVLATRPIKE